MRLVRMGEKQDVGQTWCGVKLSCALAEPREKLQAGVSLPCFLPVVSANVTAITGAVQHVEASASKLLRLLVVSCTS